MSISEVYNKVENVLERSNDARESDKVLVWLIWRREASNKFDSKLHELNALQVCKLTADSTIRRVRRKIQNEEGRFLPDEQIEKLRSEKEEEVSEWAVSN